jgi:hypothetical protein
VQRAGRAKLTPSELRQSTSHTLVPTLQFTDAPAHLPDEDVSDLSINEQPVCKSPSFDAFSMTLALLHCRAC